MNNFAGPICEGIGCAPISIMYFLTAVLPKILPIILGVGMILFGSISYLSHKKTDPAKTPKISLFFVILGLVITLIWGSFQLTQKSQQNSRQDKAINSINFDIYTPDSATEQNLQLRLIGKSIPAKIPYMLSRYQKFAVFQFNTEQMNNAFTESLTPCGIGDPADKKYFQYCEEVGQTSSGDKIYGKNPRTKTIVKDPFFDPYLVRRGNTSIVVDAYGGPPTEVIRIYDSLTKADPHKIDYPGLDNAIKSWEAQGLY